MSDETYLPGLVPFTFGMYGAIVLAVALCYNCCGQKFCCDCRKKVDAGDEEQLSSSPDSEPVSCSERSYNYFKGQSFEVTYTSIWDKGDSTTGATVLMLWRIACFCFHFGIGFLWSYINNPYSSIYFTLWNVDLLSLYFFLASLCSMIGLLYRYGFNFYSRQSENLDTQNTGRSFYWSPRLMEFGYAVQILFEISGGTAFFITVIAFATLNSKFQFWNTTHHFASSMAMLFEALLTSMPVRWEHVLLNLTWALMYLIFIWPMVHYNAVYEWPYFFLRAGSLTVYVWYVILFFLDIVFFYLFWLLVVVRDAIHCSMAANSRQKSMRAEDASNMEIGFTTTSTPMN